MVSADGSGDRVRSVVYEVARDAMLLGFFTFWIFLALGLIGPALVSAVMSAVGTIWWGFLEKDAHDRRVREARNAPKRTVRHEVMQAAFGGPYRDGGGR